MAVRHFLTGNAHGGDPVRVEKGMADLWVVLTVLAFFGLCVAVVKGCDIVIGPDADADLEAAPADEAAEMAAEVGVR